MTWQGKEWGDLWKGRVFTLSNFISAFRVFLLPFFFVTISNYAENPSQIVFLGYSILLTALAVFSDFLDGFIARLLHQESTFGRYLDPVCDKLVTVGGLGLVTYFFDFPFWILAIYIIRELVGVWFGMFLYLKRGLQGRPNWWGKLGVGLVSFSVLWYMLVPYFRFREIDSEFLYHPEYSAYLLLIVLALGVMGYASVYWKIVFDPATVPHDLEEKKKKPKYKKL